MSVWDRGTLKRNHFMGEIQLPLSVIDLEDSTDRWYALGDKVSVFLIRSSYAVFC